jgi:hypothetical protein
MLSLTSSQTKLLLNIFLRYVLKLVKSLKYCVSIVVGTFSATVRKTGSDQLCQF